MQLTDEELTELHSYLQNETMYGDDNVVYGADGDLLRQVLGKVTDEARARGFWWAR